MPFPKADHPLSGRYLFKCHPADLERWKDDAAKRGLSFAAWIRECLQAGGGRSFDPGPAMKRPEPRDARHHLRTELDPAEVQAAKPAQPPQALKSAENDYVALRERARELAQREGACTADVSKGVRCRLCGKIH